MTNEEAIEYNKNLREYMRITDKKSEYKFLNENYEALDMAIKALETVSCIKEKCAYCPHCENCDVDDETLEIKALEQQPCEDAVSRQAVIKLLSYDWANRPAHKAVESIRNLPSVTPKEKTAEWYEEDGCEGACEGYMGAGVICSQCGALLCGYIGDYDFCPNCGARMVSE